MTGVLVLEQAVLRVCGPVPDLSRSNCPEQSEARDVPLGLSCQSDVSGSSAVTGAPASWKRAPQSVAKGSSTFLKSIFNLISQLILSFYL